MDHEPCPPAPKVTGFGGGRSRKEESSGTWSKYINFHHSCMRQKTEGGVGAEKLSEIEWKIRLRPRVILCKLVQKYLPKRLKFSLFSPCLAWVCSVLGGKRRRNFHFIYIFVDFLSSAHSRFPFSTSHASLAEPFSLPPRACLRL